VCRDNLGGVWGGWSVVGGESIECRPLICCLSCCQLSAFSSDRYFNCRHSQLHQLQPNTIYLCAQIPQSMKDTYRWLENLLNPWPSARSPNLTPASCDLTFNHLTPGVDHFMPLLRGPFVPICSKISSFVCKISFSQDWQRTNEQTGERY